jgi:hypothetical protein
MFQSREVRSTVMLVFASNQCGLDEFRVTASQAIGSTRKTTFGDKQKFHWVAEFETAKRVYRLTVPIGSSYLRISNICIN